jgi:hypothetical protein
MPVNELDTPLKLHIPDACAFCAAVGRVTLKTTILTGDTVVLLWSCRRCSKEWPVTSHELTSDEDRRHGTPDRRHTTRSDRRQR